MRHLFFTVCTDNSSKRPKQYYHTGCASVHDRVLEVWVIEDTTLNYAMYKGNRAYTH